MLKIGILPAHKQKIICPDKNYIYIILTNVIRRTLFQKWFSAHHVSVNYPVGWSTMLGHAVFVPFTSYKSLQMMLSFHIMVVWNMFYFPFHIWDNYPNWRTHIFQDGYCTTNQIKWCDLWGHGPWLPQLPIPPLEGVHVGIAESGPMFCSDGWGSNEPWILYSYWGMVINPFHIIWLHIWYLDTHIW